MSQAKIVQKKIENEDVVFLATYIETKNACLMLLSEAREQLGTLAVAIPEKPKKISVPISSILLGDRNVTISRFLAEFLANKTNKIALVSVFIRTFNEKDIGATLLRLTKKTLRKEGDKE